MSQSADASAQQPVQIVINQVADAVVALKQAGDVGANWFYWIAGLSLVNTAIAHSGGDRHFIIGLSVTAIVDAIAKGIGQQQPSAAGLALAIAVGFSLCVAIVVVLFGWLSRQRLLWAFGLGMGLYLFDGLIYLALGDFLSAAFHGYALFAMSRGFRAYRQLYQLEADLVDQAASLQTLMVTTDGVDA